MTDTIEDKDVPEYPEILFVREGGLLSAYSRIHGKRKELHTPDDHRDLDFVKDCIREAADRAYARGD